MKPIESNKFSSTIYGVKLYIDDIELILSKITSINDTYIISDDDNIYESLDELKLYKGNNPEIIKIEAKDGDSFKFEYLFIRIAENIGSITSRGEKYNKLSYEIEKIYLKRKNNPFITYFFNQKNAKNNLIFLFLFFGGIYFYKTYFLKEVVDVKKSFWPIIVWLIIFFITLINSNLNGKIELKRKHEDNFLKNNKDAIIIVIITAVITYLLTLI